MKLTPGATLFTAYVCKEIPMLTNRLATVNKNGSNISFGYDGNGNVTTIGTGYSITGTTYNWQNLPTAITKSGTIYNYRYDHAGLRVYKQEGDNIHTLRGAFGEVLASYKNGSHDYWNIVRPDGSVIGRREGSTRLYYHRDHLGSTRAVVNASGTVVQTYDYYPFGLEMPGRSLTTGSTARERFTGHERDEEVGLDYMQARRYAAEFGRFLSVNPLADKMPSWNPYHYTFNNPINLVDSLGLIPQDPEELRRFSFDELGSGLAFMLQISLSGTEHAVETAGFLVEDSEGQVQLVVFDNSMNTASTSDNPRIDSDGRHNGELVIAQIHTHPLRPTPVHGMIADGNPARFSPEDHELARSHNIPVFTIGHGGRMASTLGDDTTRRHHPEARRWLQNRDNEGFFQTVINRKREQRQ